MYYITNKIPSLSSAEASQGETIFGCFSIVGNILIILSHTFELKYSTIMAQAVTALGYGVSTLLITGAFDKVGEAATTNILQLKTETAADA